MPRKIINNWKIAKGAPLTELDKKILFFQNHGCLVPSRSLIRPPNKSKAYAAAVPSTPAFSTW